MSKTSGAQDKDRAQKKPIDKSALLSPEQREEKLQEISARITSDKSADVIASNIKLGELMVEIKPEVVLDFVKFLRDDLAFTLLIDLCGVDYPERPERFEVVYHFLCMTKNLRIRIKTKIGENQPLHSVASVYPAANWFEREAFDLYGILFSAHPDLRRLLTDYGFEGHPLRKDFPLTGFVETRYDETREKVVYEPVKLAQEFRNFDFLSPWEGIDEPIPFELPPGMPGAQPIRKTEEESFRKIIKTDEPLIADPDKDDDSLIPETSKP